MIKDRIEGEQPEEKDDEVESPPSEPEEKHDEKADAAGAAK